MNAPQPCRLMRIHIGEDDRFQGHTLYAEILNRCRQADIEMVTVYRGIEGYGASTQPGHDLPIMVSVVDTEAKIRDFLPVLDSMIQGGIVVLSDVEVIKYVHAAPAAKAPGPR